MCVLHLVPRSGHPKSLQPRHFPIAIIHIGWGSSQSLLLVQPIIGIFKGSEHEKIFHPFLWIFGIEFYKNLQRTFTIVFQFSVYYRITLFILIPYLDFYQTFIKKISGVCTIFEYMTWWHEASQMIDCVVYLYSTLYNKPATHCLCLQTGVSPEHSLLLLQPEWELFLDTVTKKTKISPSPECHKNLQRNFTAS